MKFTSLTLQHKALLEKWFSVTDSMMSHNDFVTVFAWDVNGKTEFCVEDNVLTIRNVFKDATVYFYPLATGGGCAVKTLNKIRAHEGDRQFYITSIPTGCVESLSHLQGYSPPQTDRDNCDYVYNTSDLISLSGKKYHAKRNFVHRFQERYAYEFRDFRESDYAEVMALYDAWSADKEDVDYERIAIDRVIKNLDALGAKCGVITVDGVMAAFSVVSVSTRNVGQVHFEKARAEYEGAYAAINQMCAERYLSQTQYVNRQEDMGLEGLRKAKLSYHPYVLLEKYRMGSK